MGRLSDGVKAPPTITGMITLDGLLTGNFAAVWDALKHLLLPALSLAMAGLAQNARITRSSMVDNLSKDYIEAARSYGIPDRTIRF
jgi:peptide/nickel transport system permease protein